MRLPKRWLSVGFRVVWSAFSSPVDSGVPGIQSSQDISLVLLTGPSTTAVTADRLEEAATDALAPFGESGTENPYSIQHDLQQTMSSLVGIIRTEGELTKALDELDALDVRATRVRVEGHRQYNPGWHLSLDLRSMLSVSRCITQAALIRKESRGAQTRDDYPTTDPEFGQLDVVTRQRDGEVYSDTDPLPRMPDELQQLLEDG